MPGARLCLFCEAFGGSACCASINFAGNPIWLAIPHASNAAEHLIWKRKLMGRRKNTGEIKRENEKCYQEVGTVFIVFQKRKSDEDGSIIAEYGGVTSEQLLAK